MKNFDEFISYANEHSEEIHSSIYQKVIDSVDKQNFDDSLEEYEFFRRQWTSSCVMEMLQHYHNWLNS